MVSRVLSASTARVVFSVLLVAGCAALISATKSPFTASDKAYYASEKDVNFVRPGLEIKILSAEIANDGTIKTRLRLEDPRGLGLDRDGVTTPGTVSVSLIAAYIPNGQKQYVAYTTRSQTSPITGATAIQAAADAGGIFEKVADGEYVYTFRTKAVLGFDKTATHTIGAYGSRSLTEFDLSTYYSSATFNFVPDGSKILTVRDVIKTSSCNKCHDQLSFHGGSRRGMDMCVLCHTPQTVDPDTGNSVDLVVMAHKIHMGAELPSVQAGKPYQIIGFNQSVADYSEVEFPADVRNCASCHEEGPGAAAQATNFMKPNRTACGACHDNVNFATGENHADLPQISDNQCGQCHQPQGELEFDVSIKGAHTIPARSEMLTGLQYELIKVDDGTAGRKPTVTFGLKDKTGNPLRISDMQRIALVLAGPTTDYNAFQTGYISEDAGSATGANGVFTYTFNAAIPANAKGSFAVGIEGRRVETLLPGTKKEMSVQYGAPNKVKYFSVDGSAVQARRQVVAIEKCNECHANLVLHGNNRSAIEQCVLCHNPVETDAVRRPAGELPGESVSFAKMIHRIHTGKEGNGPYVIFGFGGTKNDFGNVGYPAFSPSGAVGDRRNCAMCHVNGSEHLPLPETLSMIDNPRGLINPIGPTSAACLGCHVSRDAASHALANTTRLGESCSACHGESAEFSISRVHAR